MGDLHGAAGDAVSSFVHEAFVYRGPAGFRSEAAGFVRAGVERGEAVLVAVTPSNAETLRSELGPIASRVSFVDITEVGRNPGRVIPAWVEFLEEAHARGAGARGLGELVWAGRSAAEIAECARCESLVNLAFGASSGLRLRCAYDASALPAAVVDGVWRTHPRVLGAPSAPARERRAADDDALWPDLPPPAVPGDEITALPFTAGTLLAARQQVLLYATKSGVPADRVSDLELAIHEILTNSVRHGGGAGLLRVWTEQATLVCEVSDRGQVRDALAGHRAPALDAEGGRGLWLAHQLCDLVQLRSSPAGTVVRLHCGPAASDQG
ncbi:anti-sigma regulatory factor (Ser/Thr protein kinase) [Frankia sp. EI5c]|uniref:sensor histidine kinase n=1 Tax=Frankia sp. EI5c TaxID=683316 RepID=UPI0007C3E11F|nr:sensor histidine kinase [Frankia sp. EI5c]OAA26655.1 anti-sigma regulatory factor (Ser/Thr protein kinase) [Frankia sp. EI5c]